jgi:hypothetical protein
MSPHAEFAIELPYEVVRKIALMAADIVEERPRWAPIEGVADYVGCSVRQVRGMREKGLPASRLGRRLVFDLREVDRFLEGRRS